MLVFIEAVTAEVTISTSTTNTFKIQIANSAAASTNFSIAITEAAVATAWVTTTELIAFAATTV